MEAVIDAKADRPRTRKATLYRRNRRVLVNRVDMTTDGIPFSTDEIHSFEAPFAEAELGRALRMVIAGARSGLPPLQREDWERLLQPLLRAAGVSSWRTFVRGCRDVSVFEDDGVIRFVPSVNLGPTEGFEGIAERETVIQIADDPALGRQAIQALDVAETRSK